MANAKLTALAAGTVLAGTDILYVVANPGTSPVSRKATIETVVSAAGTVSVEAVTASGTLTGAALVLTGGTIAGGTATLTGPLQVTNITATGTAGTGALTSSGLLTAANITTAGTIGAGAITSSALLTGATLNVLGTAGIHNTLTAHAVTSEGLLTAANITTAGTIGAASLTTSGNVTASGGTITLGTIVVARGTNYPAAGTWNAGDILYNSAPAAGTVTGWICTAGGTAGGAWLGFGTL
jgi:hypothetical protein